MQDGASRTVKILFFYDDASVTVGMTAEKHHRGIFRDEKGLCMTQVKRRKIEQIL